MAALPATARLRRTGLGRCSRDPRSSTPRHSARVRNGMRTPSHESRPPRRRRFRHLPAGRPPFCNVLEFCTPVQAEMSVLRQDRTTPSDETAGRLLASCDEDPSTPPRRAQNSRTLHFPSSFVAQGRKTRGHCKTYSDPPLNRSRQGEDCHSERAERRRRIHAVLAVRTACAVQGALSVEHLIPRPPGRLRPRKAAPSAP